MGVETVISQLKASLWKTLSRPQNMVIRWCITPSYMGGIGMRISALGKNARPYLKKYLKAKWLGVELKWQNTCLANMRPWVYASVLGKNKPYVLERSFFFFLLLCWVGIRCGIYKSSYNISNVSFLNSHLVLLYIIPLFLHSWNSFNRYYFSIYIHVYTDFAIYSPSHTISPPTSSFHWFQPPKVLMCSTLLFSDFIKGKKWHFCYLKAKM
jgi:hypothetical protein